MADLMTALRDAEARKLESARWVPACGGTETPMMVGGRRILYCWNSLTGQYSDHAYLDLDTDMIMTQAEVDALFAR